MSDVEHRTAQHWPKVRLANVCRIQNGWAFEGECFSKTEGTPLIRIRDLKTNSPSLRYRGAFDQAYIVNPNDLLIGMDGEFRCYRWAGPDALLNQRICRLLPDQARLNARFLQYVLDEYLREIESRTAFTTVKHLSSRDVEAFEIPLPALSEQERIARRLTEQLASVERARVASADRLASAQALPAAFLREVFEGSEWPEMRLGDGLSAIEAGTSVQSLERPARDGEWGVLKVSAVSWGKFKPEENKAVPSTFTPKSHEQVRQGDLLISRANTQELAGAVVIVRETPQRLMLSDKTLRLVLSEHIFQCDYLEYAIRTPGARKFIEHNATGTSYSMRNISQDTIRAIPLPAPPIAEQKRLATDLSHRLAEAERLTERVREEVAAIDALPAALLREAFGGYNGAGAEDAG